MLCPANVLGVASGAWRGLNEHEVLSRARSFALFEGSGVSDRNSIILHRGIIRQAQDKTGGPARRIEL